MVGSLKWFVYTTDDGTDFAIFRDESNLEAVNGGTQDYATGTTVKYALPVNVKPRIVTFESADGSIRRNIVALTPTIYNGLATNTTITDGASGLVLTYVRKRGEIVRLPRASDTGQTDGDAT